LIIPTRGDPSIAWADFDGERLSCRAGAEGHEQCDDDHRLSFVQNDADNVSIFDEPFGAFADSAGQFAIVTHLTSGAVTLIDSPRDGNAVVTDIVAGVFAADPNTGLRGATGVAGRTPNAADDIIYVGSRSEDRIQTFTVARPVNGASPFLLTGNYFFLDAVGNTNGQSVDTRGMAFSGSGERLYLVNRRPPSLQIYDTSLGPTGFPRNHALGAVDICRQASTLSIADAGDGERIFVSCFQDGQIYIINPEAGGSTDDIVTVGRGPYTVVASPSRKRLYITNFLEDTVAVLDIEPGSKTRNRVVLRIGEPRQP
jgi:DNA-binding beta-propeller fold protein YncE